MARVMNQWWWTRQTWSSEFQDYHIPLWNTRKVPAFDNWLIQKIENHPDRHALQQDPRRNQSLNPFIQNPNKWFRMLGTSNDANYSRLNPRRSAQYVSHTGTLVSSIARASISCMKKEEPIKNSSVIRWTFFQSLTTSSRKEDLMDTDMVKSRETRNTLRLTNWR